MIKYRLATLNDFDEVRAIENECFKEPYSDEDLHYEFEKNPVNKIIVAEKDGKARSWIVWPENRPDALRLPHRCCPAHRCYP